MKNPLKILLPLVVLASCMLHDNKFGNKRQTLADSLNSQCPVGLMEGEIELTGVSYSSGMFHIYLALQDEAPVAVSTLRALNEEYSRKLDEMEGVYENCGEIGGNPFIKGVFAQSPILMRMKEAIARATYTGESAQGYLPLRFCICDRTDTLDYIYNETWELLTESQWLSAIVPMEMQKVFGWTGDGKLPQLNEVVSFDGLPLVTEDGYVNILCSYDAMPYFRKPPVPMKLKDVRGKYFSEAILKEYLKREIDEHPSIERFLNTCTRRNISLRFLLVGRKDEIDSDLCSPQEIKEWESWGGNDTIIIAARQEMG